MNKKMLLIGFFCGFVSAVFASDHEVVDFKETIESVVCQDESELVNPVLVQFLASSKRGMVHKIESRQLTKMQNEGRIVSFINIPEFIRSVALVLGCDPETRGTKRLVLIEKLDGKKFLLSMDLKPVNAKTSTYGDRCEIRCIIQFFNNPIYDRSAELESGGASAGAGAEAGGSEG